MHSSLLARPQAKAKLAAQPESTGGGGAPAAQQEQLQRLEQRAQEAEARASELGVQLAAAEEKAQQQAKAAASLQARAVRGRPCSPAPATFMSSFLLLDFQGCGGCCF